MLGKTENVKTKYVNIRRKTMKKILIVALAAILLMTSFVACSKDGKEDNTSKTNINIPGENPTEAPTQPEDKEDNTPAKDRTFEEKDDTIVIMAATGAANLRKDTSYSSSTVFKSLNNNEELHRTGVTDGWSRVEYEGGTYYISNNVIIELAVLEGFEATTKTVEITATTISVRFAPGRTSDDPIAYFKKGDKVEVIGFNANIGSAGWYMVKLTKTDDQPHEFGFISAHGDYSKIIETIVETPEE